MYVLHSPAKLLQKDFYFNEFPTDGKLKEFHLDMSKGALSNVDIIPPPALSYNDVPFNYTYVFLRISINQIYLPIIPATVKTPL